MVIEKLYGLHATDITLDARFTMLAALVPERLIRSRNRQPRRNTGSFFYRNRYLNNRNLIDRIARKIQQARRQAIKQRLRLNTQRQHNNGNVNNLPGLRRSQSFSDINQRQNDQNGVFWQQSNNNLGRSASFDNLSQRNGQVFQHRGGKVGPPRTGLRGGRMQFGRVMGRMASKQQLQARQQYVRSRMGRQGRGGVGNQANEKPVPTKEELDAQLDQYMSSTKSALDKELDAYMKAALDME